MKGFTTIEMKRFNYLSRELDAAYHEAAKKLGLSDSAMWVLYTICDNGEPCPLNDICKLSGISKQTINSAIRKLEIEQILYLEAFDRKKKQIYLTEKGRTLAKQTVVHLIEIENTIFDSWEKEEREIYLELMQRYLTMFRNKIKELSI